MSCRRCDKKKYEVVSYTGEEVKTLKLISKARIAIDSIGGCEDSDLLRRQLDELLLAAYILITGKPPVCGTTIKILNYLNKEIMDREDT